jgi:hypothetical protein
MPTFEKSSDKVGVGILVVDFQGNILMSSDRFNIFKTNFASISDVTQLSKTFYFRVMIKAK